MKPLRNFGAALLLAVAILTAAVILAVNFRPLYYRSIPRIHTEAPQYTPEVIRTNYDILVDYLNPLYRGPLVLADFPMSPEGEFHFYEVKVIFDGVYLLFALSALLSLLLFLRRRRRGETGYLGLSALLVFLIPLLLAIPFLVDFSRAFVVFHEIAFNNDYWIFDPRIDPVIRILPEWFFMHAAYLILFFMLLFALATAFLWRRLSRKGTPKPKTTPPKG